MAILTTHELTERLRYEMGFTKQEAEDSMKFLIQQITETLVAGDEVWLQRFVRLKVVDRPSRNFLNAATGEMDTLAPGKRIRARFAPAIIEKVDPGYGLRLDEKGEVYSVRAIDPEDESLENEIVADEELDDAEDEIVDMIEEAEEAEEEDPQAAVRAALTDFAAAKKEGKVKTGKKAKRS